MRKCAAIDEFQLAAKRYAMRKTTGTHLMLARDLAEVMRSGFAFHGRIGGDDQLAHIALGQSPSQHVETEFLGAETIKRRQASEHDEVASAKSCCLLDRELIHR